MKSIVASDIAMDILKILQNDFPDHLRTTN